MDFANRGLELDRRISYGIYIDIHKLEEIIAAFQWYHKILEIKER